MVKGNLDVLILMLSRGLVKLIDMTGNEIEIIRYAKGGKSLASVVHCWAL